MSENLEALVQRAAQGDKAALDAVLREIKDDVYKLSMRMLGHPSDAEDATQEVLIKVLTHLGSFRGDSAFRTWVFRVAANHLMNVRRGQREIFSFEMMEAFIAQGLAEGAPPPPPDGEMRVLAEEVKLGCTEGAMLSLDRDQRLAYTLSEIFELDGETAAAVCEVESAAYRKRLSRARERMNEFMQKQCGIIEPSRPCRCEKQVGPSVAAGMLDPKRLVYGAHPRRATAQHVRELDALADKVAELQRSHPDYATSDGLTEKIRALIKSDRVLSH
jgi:RNA polymerase sigma factor (sigma-70 family)